MDFLSIYGAYYASQGLSEGRVFHVDRDSPIQPRRQFRFYNELHAGPPGKPLKDHIRLLIFERDVNDLVELCFSKLTLSDKPYHGNRIQRIGLRKVPARPILRAAHLFQQDGQRDRQGAFVAGRFLKDFMRLIRHVIGKEGYRTERFFGHFQRTVALPAPVAADKVKAQYKDGILTITLPKTEEAKPKRIDVNVN